MTKYEQELVINLNADEKYANVYSCNPVWNRRIEKLIEENPKDIKILRKEEDAYEILVPKSWIKVMPKRKMSEKQKEAARERLLKYRAAKK